MKTTAEFKEQLAKLFNELDLASSSAQVFKLEDTVDLLLERHQQMERQLLLATTFNWRRLGLTWEKAARELFNRTRAAVGEAELDDDAPLI